MTDTQHQFQIGEAVLARLGGTPIPGVIEATEGERYLVRLAEPWADESGQTSDEAWVTADKLDPSIEQETGGTQALPS